MSALKHKKIYIAFIMVIFSLFLFGCENYTPIDNIRFEEQEIVLLIGETYSPRVVVTPNYATERGYEITSNDTRIVKVENNTLTALTEGTTTIRVVSKDNELLEDYVSVQVRKDRTTLDVPRNLTYNPTTQAFNFDMVDNASSYSIKISNDTINLGNSTSYSLERYNNEYGSAYNNVLEVSVRANAATYSQAFNNSAYSTAISIYQNSEVLGVKVENGVLTFDRVESSNNYLIAIDGEEFYRGEYRNNFDLTAIDAKYAGKTVTLSVTALANIATYSRLSNYSTITFYDSPASQRIINVMNVSAPEIVDTIISWDSILYAESYNILIDNAVVGNTSATHVNITTLEDYADIVSVGGEAHTINIDPVMKESQDVLKTASKGEVKYINRLDTPTLVAEGNQLTWSSDSSQYILNLTGGEHDISIRTDLTNLSITNYPAGIYTLTIVAVGDTAIDDDKIIHLLPSASTSLVITKQTEVTELVVSDYVLSFASIIGEQYSVQIGDVVNTTITATSELSVVDLSDKAFEAGVHEIRVIHLGDGEEIFDSNVATYNFTQLDIIDNITIESGVASVVLSEINVGADIEYAILSEGVDKFTINSHEWAINTTDDSSEDYLPSGDYTIKVKVLGDGETTFSANRTGLEADYTATATFTVLSKPTMTVTDKDTGEITIGGVADSYDVYDADDNVLLENVASIYTANLETGSVNLKICSIGDGSETINSDFATISLARLEMPTLVHDIETDVIIKSDNNEANTINSYLFKHNSIETSYNFTDAYTQYAEGQNVFELKLIAVDSLDDVYYLNSAEYVLTLDTMAISVDRDNRLIITPNNVTEIHDLSVKFIIDGDAITLNSSESRLSNDEYTLEYVNIEGSYYVTLLDELYQPIISELTGDFLVSVKYTTHSDEESESYTYSRAIKYTTRPNIDRDAQYITVTNVAPSRTIMDYMLLVDDTMMPLPEDTIVDIDNQIFKIDINYITTTLRQEGKLTNGVYNIRVITFNLDTTESVPTLTSTSDSWYFTLASELSLTFSKDNDNTNNSVTISFIIEEKDYIQYFVIDVYNIDDSGERANQETITFGIENAIGNTITFNLDRITILGDIYVSGYVSTVGEYVSGTDTICVFNSKNSNQLAFTKIATVSNIYVSDGILYFDTVENAIGYDIYQEIVGEDDDNKLNDNLITALGTTVEYSLTNLSGEGKIKVKAVSVKSIGGTNYTNSNMSEVMSVYKLETPIVNIVNGDLVVTLSSKAIELLQSTALDCKLVITNRTEALSTPVEISADTNGVTLSGNKLTIEPEILLAYGDAVKVETLDIQLVAKIAEVEDTESGEVTEPTDPEGGSEEGGEESTEPTEPEIPVEPEIPTEPEQPTEPEVPSEPETPTEPEVVDSTLYINSNIVTLTVKGLLAPKNVGKTTTSESETEIVEHITWSANAGNMLNGNSVLYGYIVKIEYYPNTTLEGEPIVYYTSDSKLMYMNDICYSYDSIITDNKIFFPYGYDEDGDGTIGETEVFNYGTFVISVKAVPMTIEDENLLCSKYSEVYTVKIMAIPEIAMMLGALTWDYDINSTGYIVTVYSHDFETVLTRDLVTTGAFDFSNAQFEDYYGIYGVTVKAISDKKNVIGSAPCNMMKVFRMASGSLVTDDGGTEDVSDDITVIVDEINIEDGSLVLTANAFFDGAELEFVDTATGDRHILTYSRNQDAAEELSDLGIVTWDEQLEKDMSLLYATRKYVITIDNSEIMTLIATRAYTINVKLLGNSDAVLPIVSSRKAINVANKVAVKLDNTLTEVKTGTFKYSTTYTDDIRLNYNFNNVTTNEVKTYWNGVYIYRVTITNDLNKQDIYCIDYNSLSSMTEGTDYILVQDMGNLYAYVKYTYDDNGTSKDLYFNVYKDNTINLREDYIYYYNMDRTVTDGEISYTHVNGDGTIYSILDLTRGGVFIMSVALLGDDEVDNHAYLTSFMASSSPFVRYADNVLTSYNGMVKLNDQREYDEADTLLDSPVYKLTINVINTTDYKYVYVYYTTEEEARQIEDNPDGIYVPAEYDEYSNILFDMTKYFGEGTYIAKVQTLAGLGTEEKKGADYFLNSKEPTTSATYFKVSDASVSTNSGILQLDLSYIVKDLSEKIYIYDYEITLVVCPEDGEPTESVFNINRYSPGVTIDDVNKKLIYHMPNIIVDGEGNMFEIQNGVNYTIKARGISVDSYVLNGTYEKVSNEVDALDKTLSFTVSAGLEAESVRIEDGVLKWKVSDPDNYSKVKIVLSYMDESNSIVNIPIETSGTIIDADNNYYYSFADSKYSVDSTNTTEYIDTGKIYNISMYVVGTSNDYNAILNSKTVVLENKERLEQVAVDSIKTVNGNLTWSPVTDAVKYEVAIIGSSNTYTYTTEDATALISIDILEELGMAVGNYNITIKAIGNDKISAMNSSRTETFLMPDKVTGVKVDTDNSAYFTWDEIDGVNCYKVVFSWNGGEQIEYADTNRVKIPDTLSGAYTVVVRAAGAFNEGDNVFYGESSDTYTSSTDRPSSVNNMGYYTIDGVKLGYEWTANHDYASGDKFYITYLLQAYNNSSDVNVSQSKELYSTDPAIKTYDKDGTIYYYYQPTIMGIYTSFYVTVVREGTDTLSSASVGGGELDLHLYSYGDGYDTPYRISSAEQLLDIRFYTNAKYILESNIDLSTYANYVDETDNEYNLVSRLTNMGAIVASEFTGVLDGNNKTMSYPTDWVLNGTSFALFGEISGATIKNLTFADINIENTFANSTSNMINLSLIAGIANNATISNVTVTDLTLTIKGTMGNNANIAGLLAQATNTTITDVVIDMTLEVSNGVTMSGAYTGALIASATNCDIDNSNTTTNTVAYTIVHSSTSASFDSVGGAVGFMEGSEIAGDSKSSKITSIDITAKFNNVRASNIGAVVGNMTYSIIDNATVTSSSTFTGAIAITTNMGGVAGKMTSSYVLNTSSEVVYNVTISNASVNIGAVTGNINVTEGYDNRVINCTTNATVDATTLANGSITSLGIYGRLIGTLTRE